MYRIVSDGVMVAEVDIVRDILYNRENRCYNLCAHEDAEGFVCRVPRNVEGETVEDDVVFVLDGKSMKGGEPVGEYIWEDDPVNPEIPDSEALSIIFGGEI